MNKIISLLRVCLGFIFLWAFFDKLLGLGFSTPSAKAWIHGGSPTYGFLSGAVKGPFASFFHSLAGNSFIDIIFMAGLLFVGVTLIFNIFIKWGSIAGLAMVLLMYLAVMPPATNPIIDDHIIYAIVFAYFIFSHKSSAISTQSYEKRI
jgi:thiosulfate dehydrogenase [quinone] large subunit